MGNSCRRPRAPPPQYLDEEKCPMYTEDDSSPKDDTDTSLEDDTSLRHDVDAIRVGAMQTAAFAYISARKDQNRSKQAEEAEAFNIFAVITIGQPVPEELMYPACLLFQSALYKLDPVTVLSELRNLVE